MPLPLSKQRLLVDAEPYNQWPIGHSLNAQHRYGFRGSSIGGI